VVALALSNNRDLRVALENIEKARAQYGITRADSLPGITAQAQSNARRTGRSDDGRALQHHRAIHGPAGFRQLRAGPVGRIRNLSEASLQQFLQSQDNQRNVQIGLVADVANAWLTLAADQARLQLAKDTLDSRIKAFELTAHA
jgi:outer membrane protein TolC